METHLLVESFGGRHGASGAASSVVNTGALTPRAVMSRDQALVDPQAFFRNASWQCVRSTNATAVARALELLHYQPANVPQDLLEVDPHEPPCLVVTMDGWTYVFGDALGLKGAKPLSAEFGECLALHLDAESETYRCERAIDGEVVRRVYASGRDREFDSQGEPTAGEPQVPWLSGEADAQAIGLSVADTLGFSVAWGTDPQHLFEASRHPRAFIASRKPMVTQPGPRKRRSILATLAGALLALAAVGGIGAAVWWLVQSDQEMAAAQFCENQWGCVSCVGCTRSRPHRCAEAYHHCEESESCFALMRCLTQCQGVAARTGFSPPDPSSEACFATCRSSHAEGLEDYCAWTSCSYNDACSDLCADPGFVALAACE